jgi:hypothetical protein
MTDKQIIIDGIDVSGCEHFEECETELEWSKCLADCYSYPEGTCYGYCDEHPNCYYKQLKRAENQIVEINKMVEAKEQECEELKKECAWVKESCTLNEGINYDIWYNQKLELDQLKAENEELKETLNEGCLHNLTLMTEKRVLLQTLTEIKFWTRELLKRTGQVVPYEIKQILQEISECEVVND